MERSELTYLCWIKLFSPCTHLKELVSTAAKCGKSLFCNLAKQLFGVHLGSGYRGTPGYRGTFSLFCYLGVYFSNRCSSKQSTWWIENVGVSMFAIFRTFSQASSPYLTWQSFIYIYVLPLLLWCNQRNFQRSVHTFFLLQYKCYPGYL